MSTNIVTTPHTALVEVRGLSLDTDHGRPLFRDLSISLGRDQVALIGRNGVGKSTLLSLLAGETTTERGSVLLRDTPTLVRQDPSLDEAICATTRLLHRSRLDHTFDRAIRRDLQQLGLGPLPPLAEAQTLSRGEIRKLLLLAAKHEGSALLLLDEPTEDLDEPGLRWLFRLVSRWEDGLMVVSHHRPLLRRFEHFFLVSESGCRYVPGSFDELEQQMLQQDEERQRQYVMNLNVLAQKEREHERICRRRQRKKNVGRLHELRRRTSRARLNEKRGYAQQSQARAAKIRHERLTAVRDWAKATRRALDVKLPLKLQAPALNEDDGQPIVSLQGVEVSAGTRTIVTGIDLDVGRERLAIIGPNGAGKTTLLRTMLGHRRPTRGTATRRIDRIGAIAQGATDWMRDESLLESLMDQHDEPLERLAARLMAHKFPLALAQRPLRSLSPGERVRAALICLFARAPQIELLVLDEPTYSLDFVGLAALRSALASWPGGLVVASHQPDFLEAIGIDRTIRLDGSGQRVELNAAGHPMHPVGV